MSLRWGRAVLARLRVPVSDRVVVPTLVIAFALVAWLVLGGSLSQAIAPAALSAAADEATPSTVIREAQFCQLGGLSDRLPGAECAWQTVPLAKMWSG
ncbi:MAG: hypothetical protein H7276_02120, partial [Caulobacter sp.]|nr:hypothetical protein [Vitreoscilla sp.]